MALNYGFCLGDLNREYTSKEFSDAINAVFGDGVSEYGMQFSVSVNGFQPSVDSGYAVAAGRYLENDAREALTISPSSNTEDRTDAIAVRVDHAARKVELSVLEDVDPEAIEQDAGIIRDSTKYCLVLYFVKVRRGVTTLAPDDVTDARGNASVCGYLKPLSAIAGSVLTVYDFVVSGFEQKVAELLQNGDFVIRTGERALAALETVVEESMGFYLGDVVIAVNKPGRSADWLLCDGSNVPEEYPELSALLDGVLPDLPQADTRLRAWMYTGAPHPFDGSGQDDTYTVTASASPASSGQVSGGGTYAQSSQVSLTATPKAGSQFQYWKENGKKISESTNYSFRLYCNRVISAIFEAIYNISTSVSPSGAGTASGAGVYKKGTTATVRATAGYWYRFVEWMENNASVSTSTSFSFSVDRDRSLVALFAEIAAVRISATVSPSGSGSVSGAGTYREGDTVRLSASVPSNKLYKFSEWTENGQRVSVSSTYTFVAATDRTFVAMFEAWSLNWAQSKLVGSYYWSNIAYGNGKFAVVQNGSWNKINYSQDAKVWAEANIDTFANFGSVTYGNGKFVAIGSTPAYSNDAINWTGVEDSPLSSVLWLDIAYGNGKFVATSFQGDFAVSSDGKLWEKYDPISVTINNQEYIYGSWKSIAFGNGRFVTVNTSGVVSFKKKAAHSTDGENWVLVDLPYEIMWNGLTYGNGKFVAVGHENTTTGNTTKGAYSTDGKTWYAMAMPIDAPWSDVAYGDGKFVAVADDGTCAYSLDGINWSASKFSSAVGNGETHIAYGNGRFVIIKRGEETMYYGIV